MSSKTILCVLLIVLILGIVSCDKTTSPSSMTLSITNSIETGETISTVQYRVPETEDWKPLSGLNDIARGESKSMTLTNVSEGNYDIQAIDALGNKFTTDRVNLTKGSNSVTFSTADPVSITIKNNTGLPITTAEYKPEDGIWVVITLPETIENNESYQITEDLGLNYGTLCDIRVSDGSVNTFTYKEILRAGNNIIVFDNNASDRITLSITNMTRMSTASGSDSVYAIGSVYVREYSEGGTNGWGDNLNFANIYYNQTRAIHLPVSYSPGQYDIRLISIGRTGASPVPQEIFERMNVTLDEGNTPLTFTASDVVTTVAVTITNQTGIDTNPVRYRVRPNTAWVDLTNLLLLDGASGSVYLPSDFDVNNSYDIQIQSRTGNTTFKIENLSGNREIVFTDANVDGSISFRVENNTTFITNGVFVKRVGTDTWSSNVSSAALPIGAMRIVYLPANLTAGNYDIQIRVLQGNDIRNVFQLSNKPLIVGTQPDGFVASFTPEDLAQILLPLKNNTETTTNSVWVKRTGTSDWGNNLDNSGFSSGSTKQIYLPYDITNGDYDIQLRNTDGANYTKENISLQIGTNNDTITFAIQDLQNIGLKITNDTELNTNALYVKQSGTTEWIRVSSKTIAIGSAVNFYLNDTYAAGSYDIRLATVDGALFTRHNISLQKGGTLNELTFVSNDQETQIAVTITQNLDMTINTVFIKRAIQSETWDDATIFNISLPVETPHKYYLHPDYTPGGQYDIRLVNSSVNAIFQKRNVTLNSSNNNIVFSPADIYVIKLDITNETGVTISRAYIKLSSSPDWGDDLFTSMPNMPDSTSRTLYLPEHFAQGTYDIELRTIGNSPAYFTKRNLQLAPDATNHYTFTPNDISVSSITIANRTGIALDKVLYKEAGNNNWSNNLLPNNSTISHGQTRVVYFPQTNATTYSFQVGSANDASFTISDITFNGQPTATDTLNFIHELHLSCLAFTAVNNTGKAINQVRIRQGEGNWTTLTQSTIIINGSKTFYLKEDTYSAGTYDIQLRTATTDLIEFTLSRTLAINPANVPVIPYDLFDCTNRIVLTIRNDENTPRKIDTAFSRLSEQTNWAVIDLPYPSSSSFILLAPNDSVSVFLPVSNTSGVYDLQLRFHDAQYASNYLVYSAFIAANKSLNLGYNVVNYSAFVPDQNLSIDLTNSVAEPIDRINIKKSNPTINDLDTWGSNVITTAMNIDHSPIPPGHNRIVYLPTSITPGTYHIKVKTQSGIEYDHWNTTIGEGTNALYITQSEINPNFYWFAGSYWRVLVDEPDKQLLLKIALLGPGAYPLLPGETWDGVSRPDENYRMRYYPTLQPVTWADSPILEYLNEEYYNSFNPTDKAQILLTEVVNQDNQWHATPGGEVTYNHIFLLSLYEAALYFCSGEHDPSDNDDTCAYDQLLAGSTITGYITDRDDVLRRGYYPHPSNPFLPTSWWLRSPGSVSRNAAFVNSVGNINIDGVGVNLTNHGAGVRPALWRSKN